MAEQGQQSDRGFASMDDDMQSDSAGLNSQGQTNNNTGNFANNPERAREAGREGGSR